MHGQNHIKSRRMFNSWEGLNLTVFHFPLPRFQLSFQSSQRLR